MTSLEDRLHDALTRDERPVSPDLFARVAGSIQDDRRRRRRLRRAATGWLVGLTGLTLALTTLTPRTPSGGVDMPWWILEVAVSAVLVVVALWLGPFIKRFGRAYAADVFHDNPMTGKSFIVLSDIVYYLIFGAYILLTSHASPEEDWKAYVGNVTGAQANWELRRVGGILLIIGLLHGVNLVLMPVLGRLFSLNRRLPGA